MLNIKQESANLKKEYWPFDVSNEGVFSIGEMSKRLSKEYKNISISKLRLLEDNNLIFPKRSSNGYRRYSIRDFVRTEFILSAQRDYFWPIEVIKKRLKQLDKKEVEVSELISGYNSEYIKVSTENQIVDNLTVDDLSSISGLNIDEIEDILIKLKKNIHDVRVNPKTYIKFFKKWNELKQKGFKFEHFNLLSRNIVKNKEIFDLVKTEKESAILFQSILFDLL